MAASLLVSFDWRPFGILLAVVGGGWWGARSARRRRSLREQNDLLRELAA